MRRLYGKQSVDTPQSLPGASQTHRKGRLVAQNQDVSAGPVTRVKTDGRIGSVTPPSYLKGGLTVDNNSDAQPHAGGIGAVAAKHMGPHHQGGDQWTPRVAKARKMAKPNAKSYANPVNQSRGPLVPKRPD